MIQKLEHRVEDFINRGSLPSRSNKLMKIPFKRVFFYYVFLLLST